MDKRDKKYLEWKARVNVRDNFICQKCGVEGNHAHHIQSWAEYPDLRYDIDNGMTLCLNCHAKTHKGRVSSGVQKKSVLFCLQFETHQKLKMISMRICKPMGVIIDELISSFDIPEPVDL